MDLMQKVEKNIRDYAKGMESQFLGKISKDLAEVCGYNESRGIYHAILSANKVRQSQNGTTLPEGFDSLIEYGFYRKKSQDFILKLETIGSYFE